MIILKALFMYHTFQIYLQSQLKFLLLYSRFSHNKFRLLQVKYNITCTVEVPSLLQRIRISCDCRYIWKV
jgi:hypothetical protein